MLGNGKDVWKAKDIHGTALRTVRVRYAVDTVPKISLICCLNLNL